MQAMESTTAPTKVIYGVNELDLDLAGKSIRGIWKVLEQVLNIPREAAVSVNGARVEGDQRLPPGDAGAQREQGGACAAPHDRSPITRQSRTFLRIEGDLVSLVTEVIDREVALPDLLTELTSSQVGTTPRLATGCRLLIR